MANAYISLSVFKASAGLDISGTAYDTRLRSLIENVSREVDNFCERIFYYTVETRLFDGTGKTSFNLPDLIAIPGSGLKEDENNDGTFETVWGTSDFLYAPYNATPTSTSGRARPYTKLLVNTKSNGTQDSFVRGQQNYEITGTWGFSRVLIAVLGTNVASIDSTMTTMTLSASGTVGIGDTYVIDNEQVYITGTGTGSNLTLERGSNFTVATAHTASAVVSHVIYPGPIQEAVLIQSARLWKRRDSGFASQVGLPETGQFVIFSGGLDKDVKQLLSEYVIYRVG